MIDTSAFDALTKSLSIGPAVEDLAVGIWTDDPENPGITAIVFQGDLIALTIPKKYERLTATQLLTVCDAVVGNAWMAYQKDKARLNRVMAQQ